MNIIFSCRTSDHLPYFFDLIAKLSDQNHNIILIFYGKVNYKNNELINQLKLRNTKILNIKHKKNIFNIIRVLISAAVYSSVDYKFYALRLYNLYIKSVIICNALHFFSKYLNTNLIVYAFNYLLKFTNYKTYYDLFKKIKPDVVYVCPGNIRESYEASALYACKLLNIDCNLLVMSWDATSTKCLYDKSYTNVFCWNKFHMEDLIKIHKIDHKKIYVVGSLYHQWVILNSKVKLSKPSNNKRREKYRILWLGSSKNIVENEVFYIKKFISTISALNYIITVRSHPANLLEITDLNNVDNEAGALKFDDRLNDFQYYNNFDFIIGINTTAMLDAALSGKKVHYFSCRNEKNINQFNTKHFNRLVDYASLKEYSNFKDITYINDFNINMRNDNPGQRIIDISIKI
jgi:hypothetical protein